MDHNHTRPVLIVYATREGHTHRIADYLAGRLRQAGLPSEVRNAAELPAAFGLDPYRAAVVAASVHVGQHEKEVVEFVRRHLWALHSMPTAFLSVSLSEAGVEMTDAPPEKREAASADVHRMIDEFLELTGWQPGKIQAVAGALLYTKYNFFLRLLMKRIAKAAGGDTDTSRDHEYTDWKALDHFVEEFLPALAEVGGVE